MAMFLMNLAQEANLDYPIESNAQFNTFRLFVLSDAISYGY